MVSLTGGFVLETKCGWIVCCSIFFVNKVWCLCLEFVGSFSDSLFDSSLHLFQLAFVLFPEWLDIVVVNKGGACGWGVEQPDQGGYFKYVVERNECQDESSKLVNNWEEPEHNPVSQPLLIVVFPVWLKSVETHEHGVSYSNQVCKDSLSNAEHDEQDQENQWIL